MQVSAPEPPAALPAAQSRPVAAGEGVRPLVLVHNFELQVLQGEIAHLRVVAAAVGEVAVQLLEGSLLFGRHESGRVQQVS